MQIAKAGFTRKKALNGTSKLTVKAVGGKENIISVANCMTRLRLVLKDDSIPDNAKVKWAYSIFVVFLTRKGAEDATKYYLNPLVREATQVLIDEVYKAHYEHYRITGGHPTVCIGHFQYAMLQLYPEKFLPDSTKGNLANERICKMDKKEFRSLITPLNMHMS